MPPGSTPEKCWPRKRLASEFDRVADRDAMTEDDALGFINDTTNVPEISPMDIPPAANPKKEKKQKESQEDEDKKMARKKKKIEIDANEPAARKLDYHLLCRCGLSCVSRQANNSDICDDTAFELYKLVLKN